MAAPVHLHGRRQHGHNTLLPPQEHPLGAGKEDGSAIRTGVLAAQLDVLGKRVGKLLGDGPEVCSAEGAGAERVEDAGCFCRCGHGDRCGVYTFLVD